MASTYRQLLSEKANFAQFFCSILSTILTITENKLVKMRIGNFTRENRSIGKLH